MFSLHKRFRSDRRRGFTLIELLMAMAITLLLMAALGKAFATIGRTMKEGRSEVTLSAKLRGLSFRVRSDLRTRTVRAKPPIRKGDDQGYFLYYEGPLTEHSAALFGAEAFRVTTGGDEIGSSSPAFATTLDSPTYYRHSRYGDIDDYLAFTAEAPANGWFTGKVPAYIVEDNPPDSMAPRIIRSKYAEIIMWTSPKWQVDDSTNDLLYSPAPSGMPLFVDDDNDFLPDSVTLHQRILLIRPDLNAAGTITGSPSGPDFDSDYLRTVGGGGPSNVPAALTRIYPISNPALPPGSRYYPSYLDATSLTTAPENMFVSNWLVGMTPVHQFFDISLRRIVNPVTGEPSEYVAANSLEDLAEPHNRFGHVRYPGRYFGLGGAGVDNATSMPLLALAWNDSLLRRATPPAWFPAGYPSPTTLFDATGSQRTSLFNGWLLPQFALGDPNPPTPDAAHWQRNYLLTADHRWDRTGEDVMGANIHGFDIKGYDETAPVFLTSGLDGAPGRAAVDDDATSDTDLNYLDPSGGPLPKQLRSELGAVGSDDVIVRVGDIAVNSLMQQLITDPRDADAYFAGTITPLNGGREDQMLASTGDFVDLFYPYLAGGPMLDLSRQSGIFPPLVPPPVSPPTPPAPAPAPLPAPEQARVNANFNNYARTRLSGWPQVPRFLSPLKSSGKLFHSDGLGNYAYMQPCYDTWTDRYESDGFDQTAHRTGEITGTNGTVWVLYNATGGYPGRTPRMAPATASPFTIDTGQYDPSLPESLPPFASDLPAISITIRLADPATQQLSQVTVVEDLLD